MSKERRQLDAKQRVELVDEKERVEQLEKYCAKFVHVPESLTSVPENEKTKKKDTILHQNANEVPLYPAKSIADQSYHPLPRKASHTILRRTGGVLWPYHSAFELAEHISGTRRRGNTQR